MPKRGGKVIQFAAPAPDTSSEEELVSRPPAGEVGLSGTTNWTGDIFDEANPSLNPQAAFGRPGQREWGFYTKATRTDPAVSAALEHVASMLRDAEVGVKAADIPEGETHSEFVLWNLKEAMAPGWPELIQAIPRRALGHGFALFEECWENVPHELLPGGSGYAVTKLAERLPVSVHQNGWIEKDGELDHIIQHGQGRNGQWQQLHLPANKVSLFSWNREGNNYRGVSQFRPVYHLIRVREQLAKLIGVTLVREGAGLPVAFTTDPKAKLTDKQRKALSKLLANMVFHENASAVMPAGWDIKWIYSPGANKGHVVDTYNALGVIIMQQTGAQHLALGTQGEGNRAVGQVHTAQSRNFARGVATFIEGVFNGIGKRTTSGLIRKLVDANWGPQKAYPKLTLTLPRAEMDPLEESQAMKTAVDGGLITVTEKDEAHFRDKWGMRPLEEGEREAELQKRAERAPQLQPGFEEGIEEEEEKKKAPPKKLKASAHWLPRRSLRPSEMAIDFAAIDSRLTGARDEFEKGLRPLLLEALVTLAPDIKEAMADGDPSEVASLKLPTKRIEAFVDKYLATLHGDGWRELAKEWRKRGGPRRFEEEDERDPAPTPPEASPTQKTLTAMRKQVVRRLQNRVLSDVEREAIEVIRQGGEPAEVVARTVQTQLETGALRSDAGLLVTKAFNMGREDFARTRGDEVESVELSALLDGNQCIECDALDGAEFEPFSAEHEAHVPPLTSICKGSENCRCLLVYRFRE